MRYVVLFFSYALSNTHYFITLLCQGTTLSWKISQMYNSFLQTYMLVYYSFTVIIVISNTHVQYVFKFLQMLSRTSSFKNILRRRPNLKTGDEAIDGLSLWWKLCKHIYFTLHLHFIKRIHKGVMITINLQWSCL